MRRIALFAITLMCVSSCSRSGSHGVSTDKKLVHYLPAGITILAGANVRSILESPLYKRHQGELPIHPAGGVVPQKDISQVLAAWSDNSPVIIAGGDFQNVTPRSGMTLPEPGILAVGPPQYLQSISSQHGEIPDGLRSQMRQVPHADQLWIVSDHGIPLDRMPGSADVHNALSNIAQDIRAFNIGLGVDDGMHLHGDLICDSEAGAKRVHDALRGVIGMARLMTHDDQTTRLKLYDAIQVDQDKSTVHVHADLSSTEADSAISLLQQGRKH